MTILHIKYFITVAECRNFTQAAEQLFITQPSLSRQIMSMENELNVTLFIRHRNHSIELTPAGMSLLDSFKEIYNNYQKSVEQAQKIASNINGSLRIGILNGEYIGDFMPILTQYFLQNYPSIDIYFKAYNFKDLTKKLYNKELDIIFTLYFSVKELDNLNFQIISQSKDCIAMSIYHPLASVKSLSLTDLKDERFIIISKEDCKTSADLIIDSFKKIHTEPNFIYAPDSSTLCLWVESGYGIAVVDSRNILQFHPTIVLHEFESSWDPSLTVAWHRDNSNPIIPVFLNKMKSVIS